VSIEVKPDFLYKNQDTSKIHFPAAWS